MQEPNQLDCWSRGHTAWTQDCYVRFGSKKEAMEESIRCPIRTVASSGAPRQQRRAGVLDGMTVPVRIQNIESEDVLRVSPVCVATPSPPVCVLRLSIATPSKSSALDPRFKSSFRYLLLELHVTEATKVKQLTPRAGAVRHTVQYVSRLCGERRIAALVHPPHKRSQEAVCA